MNAQAIKVSSPISISSFTFFSSSSYSFVLYIKLCEIHTGNEGQKCRKSQRDKGEHSRRPVIGGAERPWTEKCAGGSPATSLCENKYQRRCLDRCCRCCGNYPSVRQGCYLQTRIATLHFGPCHQHCRRAFIEKKNVKVVCFVKFLFAICRKKCKYYDIHACMMFLFG